MPLLVEHLEGGLKITDSDNLNSPEIIIVNHKPGISVYASDNTIAAPVSSGVYFSSKREAYEAYQRYYSERSTDSKV